ncbi:MAG TPA: ribonuclease HII [bacterium]|nr:ribonuclease HII [bacterium]
MSRLRQIRPTLAAVAALLAAGELQPTSLLRDPRRGARLLVARWKRQQRRAEAERRRLENLFAAERNAWAAGLSMVAGVDEVGRGPIAGPVVAAAVIFPEVRFITRLRDSKQVPAQDREGLYDAIMESGAAIGLGIAAVEEIDLLNIMGATRLAWTRAIESLNMPPALVLLDGNIQAPVTIPQRTVVKGDAKCACIAAASIIAKVTRDRWMVKMDRRHPEYGFARHKGYRTVEHMTALRRWGPSPIHRQRYLPPELRPVQLTFR